MGLVLEIEHLMGVSYGAVSPDGDIPDWPPQPDRVFSGLVASWAFRGCRQGEEDALKWLEAQEDPEIWASQAHPRSSHVSFVPPNDATLRTHKHDKDVLPLLRSRYPRSFPAARPYDPVVRLRWKTAEPQPAILSALQALAADTAYIGHSASLTRCRFSREAATAGETEWRRPGRGIYRGRLDELKRDFAAGRRPRRGRWIPSERAATVVERPGSVFSQDWLVLESPDIGSKLDVRASALVTQAVRHALAKAYAEAGLRLSAPEEVTGLARDGTPSRRPHLAIVPLTFNGFPYADGRLLGLALVPPAQAKLLQDPSFLTVLRSLAPMDPASGRRLWSMTLGRAGEKSLEIALWPTLQASRRSLDPDLYLRLDGKPARTFGSVTPVVLEHHPKGSGITREDGILEQIAQACHHAGLPDIERTGVDGRRTVAAGQTSSFEGIPPASPRSGSPNWERWQLPPYLAGRPLVHAVITFREPVAGPVLLGAGRHLGLGLFRPLRGSQP